MWGCGRPFLFEAPPDLPEGEEMGESWEGREDWEGWELLFLLK